MKTAKTSHPDETALLRHAAADLSRSAAASTRKHLSSCAACRKRFATTQRIHRSLEAIAAQEKRSTQRSVPVTRMAGYRETVGELFSGVRQGERAGELLRRAARSGPDELAAAMRALGGNPYRGLAFLYAARKGTSLVGFDPNRALALAKAIQAEAESLAEANRVARATTPAPRQAVQAEALLLEAQALVQMGEIDASRAAISSARRLFAEAENLGFGAALCDYHEGESANFGRAYEEAEALIKNALGVFEKFGQDYLLAKSESVIGTILSSRGNHEEALPHFDRAIPLLDAELDARALTMTLNNRANALAQMGRFGESRATYAKALTIALRNDFAAQFLYIRTGLAELDFLRGQYTRALRAFREVAANSAASGSETDGLFARLYVAECLGRRVTTRWRRRSRRFDTTASRPSSPVAGARRPLHVPRPGHDRRRSRQARARVPAGRGERRVKRVYRALRRA